MSLGLTDKLKKSPKIKDITSVDGGLHIKWTKVEGAEKYAVKRSTDPSEDFEHLTWVKKPEYTDEATEKNVTYWYRITAWKKLEGKKTSTKTSAVKAAVISEIKAPENVKLKAEKKPAITLSWKNIEGAEGCIISRRNDFHSQIIPVAVAEGTSYCDESIVTGQPYHYSLQYFQRVGDSLLHGNFSEEIGCIHLDCGKILSVKRHLFSGVELSLRLVAGADGYILYRKGEGEDFTEVARTDSGFELTVRDKTAGHLKKYTYAVAAYKKIDEKEFLSRKSAEVSLKTV